LLPTIAKPKEMMKKKTNILASQPQSLNVGGSIKPIATAKRLRLITTITK
jgi:hypothetical protein